jgi:LysM repeat protein
MRRFFVALALALGSGLMHPGAALAAEVVVKSGETLSEIADRFNISVSTLMKMNGISDADLIETGRRLKVPGSSGGGTRAGSGSGGAGQATGGATVVVRPGETLSEIADRHNLSVKTLMKLNGITDADSVEAGRTLVLGSASGSRPAGTTSTGTSPSSYTRGASVHVVRSGESLSGIADGYGLPLSRLVALNGISDPDKVDVGTRLKLKGSVPSAPAARTETATANIQPAAAKPVPVKPAAARPATASVSPTPATIRPAGTPATGTGTTGGGTVMATGPRKPSPAAGISSGTAAAAPRPDWRTYGPLQVDWSNWQPMGGSLVAPTLNGEGQSLYLAINCSARKLNATSQSGQWKTWDDPQADFEQQLISDLCKSRGG